MKYLHRFKTTEDFNQEFHGDDYKIPWVSVISANTDTLQYNKTKEQEEEEERQKLLGTPLTFEVQSNGDIMWKTNSTGNTRTIEYSKDNGQTWTSITSATGDTAPSISVVSGDTVQFRGNNASYYASSYYNYFSDTTCSFSLKGNIMSLINSTNFSDLTTLESAFTLSHLFSNCTGLTDASKLLLPATTLTDSCYEYMFLSCTSLVNGPSSIGTSATTMTVDACTSMFYGCTSLTQAPELPATTLRASCYSGMFRGCSNLITAPELPSTTLADSCYQNMFLGCTNLITAPTVLPASALARACYYRMFSGCTSLTTAPALPATTLASNCYNGMFRDCSSLNYIKCLATDISAANCTVSWVSGVAASGIFVTPSSTNWSTGASGIPSGWTRVNAS